MPDHPSTWIHKRHGVASGQSAHSPQWTRVASSTISRFFVARVAGAEDAETVRYSNKPSRRSSARNRGSRRIRSKARSTLSERSTGSRRSADF